jgi:D-lactate dehydrogenase
MTALVDVIIGKFDGWLKAEHGTGRDVAPASNVSGVPQHRPNVAAEPARGSPPVLGPDVVLTADEGIRRPGPNK